MEKTCPAGRRVNRLPDWSYGGRAKGDPPSQVNCYWWHISSPSRVNSVKARQSEHGRVLLSALSSQINVRLSWIGCEGNPLCRDIFSSYKRALDVCAIPSYRLVYTSYIRSYDVSISKTSSLLAIVSILVSVFKKPPFWLFGCQGKTKTQKK